MGLFDSFKNIFKKADDLEKTLDNAQAQAEMVTKAIPGDADDKFVDQANQQVDQIQEKFDEIKQNIPGNKE